jgi:hypothetical protein
MKKKSVIGVAAIATSVFMFSGCATITRGSSESFVVETDPPGAEVELSNGLRGKTPASFKVKRSDDLYVRIKKEGYEPIDANVTSTVNGGAAVAGNLIFGGLIGLAVDAGTGSAKTHKPNPLSVKLVPINKDVQPDVPNK